MKKINLDGTWKLSYFPQNDYQINNPEQLKDVDVKTIAAAVPGNVELDLEKAGEIADPFYGDNINNLKPYETYECWYQKEFPTPKFNDKQRVELIFQGVDCLATYWLNGEKIGYSENMFIEHKFDITDNLNAKGENLLTVRLRSPLIEAQKQEYYPYMSSLPTNREQLWIRKAPHSYGWDIMPRALSAGLWRSVEINIHNPIEIKDVHFYTESIDENTAQMGVFYQLDADVSLLDDIKLEIIGKCGASTFTIEECPSFVSGNIGFEVNNPQLWWPGDYGKPNLYQVIVKLIFNGNCVHELRQNVGMRTVKLERTELAGKEYDGQFQIEINNVPIMCKGSNWVPLDAFHSRDASKYEKIMELVEDLNCNILRCWGGNVYEDHEFFNICDEKGIMVWQDFAMACAAYPQADEFKEKIKKEAGFVVKKLRNHPSLILWCGDNECDYNYFNRGFDPAHNKITRKVLPEIVFRNDPYTPYLPSSPYITPAVNEKKDLGLLPENHLWGPRDYFKSRYYTESKANFVSEMGYHGCPSPSSIKKFIDKEHFWPWQDNDQWLIHSTAPQGENSPYAYRIELMADQIKELFGEYPDNLEDFALASQISQAEAKKFFIETTRIKKWERTGIIWWNVMDGWPQFSDAIVDYYFNKKLAYHYIKRVQQPVTIMIDEPESWHVNVVVSNDSLKDVSGNYKIWDADSEAVLLSGEFTSAANQNTSLGKIRVSRGEQRLFLMEWNIDDRTFANHYLLGTPPFSLNQYREWLKKISSLSPAFDAEVCD